VLSLQNATLSSRARGTRVVAVSTMTKRLGSGQERALVHVSPQTQTALMYVRGALFNPVSLSVMAFTVCVGVGYAGVVGAAIAVFVFMSLCATATRYGLVRRQLDKQYEYRRRQKREADRMKLLKPTGPVRQQQYSDLRDLVGDIERTDPDEA